MRIHITTESRTMVIARNEPCLIIASRYIALFLTWPLQMRRSRRTSLSINPKLFRRARAKSARDWRCAIATGRIMPFTPDFTLREDLRINRLASLFTAKPNTAHVFDIGYHKWISDRARSYRKISSENGSPISWNTAYAN